MPKEQTLAVVHVVIHDDDDDDDDDDDVDGIESARPNEIEREQQRNVDFKEETIRNGRVLSSREMIIRRRRRPVYPT